MRKNISTFLIGFLLSSCVARDANLASNEDDIVGVMYTQIATTDDLLDQATVDANPDAYRWLVEDITDYDVDSDPCAEVVAMSDSIAASSDLQLIAEKSAAVRALIKRFLQNSWSKLAKTGNEAAAVALNKLVNDKGLQAEAAEALGNAIKQNPTSATDATKAFLAWIRSQSKSKLALGTLAIVISAGLLPFAIDELKDALKRHVLGIETDAEKLDKLKKEIEELKAKVKLGCNQQPDDGAKAALDALEAKVLEYKAARDKYETDVNAVGDELAAIEQALAGVGLDKVEPDMAGI